jgi:hypothetical protein
MKKEEPVLAISVYAKKELYEAVVEMKRRGIKSSTALGLICGRFVEQYATIPEAVDGIQELFRNYKHGDGSSEPELSLPPSTATPEAPVATNPVPDFLRR